MDYVVNARCFHIETTRSTIHAARPPKRRAALLARRYARRRQVSLGPNQDGKDRAKWQENARAMRGMYWEAWEEGGNRRNSAKERRQRGKSGGDRVRLGKGELRLCGAIWGRLSCGVFYYHQWIARANDPMRARPPHAAPRSAPVSAAQWFNAKQATRCQSQRESGPVSPSQGCGLCSKIRHLARVRAESGRATPHGGGSAGGRMILTPLQGDTQYFSLRSVMRA